MSVQTITPQWVDHNISPSFFREHSQAKEGKIALTKIFYTLQGEGPFAGRPSVFIRLAGCNRGAKEDCQWCDTRFMINEATWIQPEKLLPTILAEISPLVQIKDTVAVLTGGEPSIQANASLLIQCLNGAGMHVQIESNGDFLLQDLPKDMVTLIVSPKIGHLQGEYSRLKEEVRNRVDYLKFVVSADKQSPYHNLPFWVGGFEPRHVYVSPCAIYRRQIREDEVASAWDDDMVDRQATRENHAYAASLCMKFGYTLSIQKHLFIGLP